MFAWLVPLCLMFGAPAPTQPVAEAPSPSAPLQIATDPPATVPASEGAPPRPVPLTTAPSTTEGPHAPTPLDEQAGQAERRARKRRNKGKRALITGAAAYTAGMALTWGSAAGAQALGNGRRRRDAVGATIGMVFGGTLMFEGALLAGLGANQLGKRAPKDKKKSQRLRGGGGALLGLGVVGVVSSGLMWTSLRDRCSAGAACGLGVIQASGLVLSTGAGMVGYGRAIGPSRSRERLPRKAREPLVAGLSLMGAGYFTSAVMGTAVWSGNRDEASRRIRNRMYIPVVGPWIVAAGPDVNFFMAAVTGGMGLMQIGGAAAATVGIVRARRGHEPRVSVVPTGTGAKVVGRF